MTVLLIAVLCLAAVATRAMAGQRSVTLMLSPSDASRAQYEQLRDEFNRDNPDIHFDIVWSDISQKMQLLVAASALPDLVALPHFNLMQYSRELIDLDAFADRSPAERDQFYPQLIAECRYQKSLKLMPVFFNVPLLYYRPDLFRAAGVAYPDKNWTWADYRAAAKKLTQRGADGKVEIWGTSLQQGWWVVWLGFIRQAGGDLIDSNGALRIGEPATAEAISFLHALIHEDGSAPSRIESPNGGFMSGEYAMDYGGHVLDWIALRKSANFEWDVAELPAGPAGKATGDFAVAGLGIWRGCKDPEAAWRVLSFLTSKSTGARFCRAGMPPVRKDVTAEAFLPDVPGDARANLPLHRAALIDTLAFASATPKLPTFSPLAQGAAGPDIQAILADPNPDRARHANEVLGRDCAGYLQTVGTKQSTSRWCFLPEIVIAAAVATYLLRRIVRTKSARPSSERSTNRLFFAFISPWIVGMLLLTVGPLAVSLYWSHTDYSLVDSPRFVGLAQYQSLLTRDPDFWHSLRITFAYAAIAVPASLVVAMLTALLLNSNSKGIGFFRTLFYLPSILPVAASGIMWTFLLNPHWGLINRLLGMVGIAGPGWLYDPHWALISLVIIGLWGFGGPMIIFLAGLKGIPESLYEAANIDGAGRLHRFLHITLPMLSPVIFFNLTMGLIGALQIFDVAYIVGSAGPGIGEPEKSTYFYVLNLFDKAFLQLHVGLGSAMAWLLFAITLLITAINFGVKRFWVFSEGAA